jgi:AcrR family transcriptional regulator
MSEVTVPKETDVRERILIAAERLFREVGYQNADIAKTLRMSPANIYRFFDSNKLINLGVARRLMGQVEAESQGIADAPGSAAKRLRDLLTTIHQMNASRYVGNSKMHEMVAVAIEENCDVCRPHMECITGIITKVITAGIVAGDMAGTAGVRSLSALHVSTR